MEAVLGSAKSTLIDALILGGRERGVGVALRKVQTSASRKRSNACAPICSVARSRASLSSTRSILTHCLRPGILTWEEAARIDIRLAAIGCKLLLFTGSKDTVWSCTLQDRGDSQFLTRYALKFGQIQQKIYAHFPESRLSSFACSASPSGIRDGLKMTEASITSLRRPTHSGWSVWIPGASGSERLAPSAEYFATDAA